jgi:hypothetical protein
MFYKFLILIAISSAVSCGDTEKEATNTPVVFWHGMGKFN